MLILHSAPAKRVKLAVPVGGGSNYTATHYVAPFASVSGGANDYADLGATSWTNAADSGTPTTLGTAMARATAGNQVQCAAGVYTGVHNDNRFLPVFKPTYSGTSGNEIVFYAVNPAASNYGTTALYSELRHNGSDGGVGIETSPAMGATGVDYVIFDGFYAKFTTAFPAPSGGTFLLHTCTGCQIRRIAVDCNGTIEQGNDYNNQAIWCGEAHSATISDCYFSGNTGTHKNECHIQAYGCDDLTIQYCTHDCLEGAWSIFIKGASNGYNSNTIIRYNRVNDGGISVGNVDNASVYNNLVVGNNPNAASWSGFWYYPDMAGVQVYNNTFVLTGTYTAGAIIAGQEGTHTGTTSQFYDNIVVQSGSQSYMLMFNGTAWGHGSIIDGDAGMATEFNRIEGNVYFQTTGTIRWNDGDNTLSTSIAAWQSNLAAISMAAAAQEDGSVADDPDFVGSGDYRLQAGSPALTGVGGRTTTAGCYVTGSELIGVRAAPSY